MAHHQITMSYVGDAPTNEQLNRLIKFMDRLIGFTIITCDEINEETYRRHAVQAISVLGTEIERNEQDERD